MNSASARHRNLNDKFFLLEDCGMTTQRRFIEVGPEAEGIDDKTKKIIKAWEKDGWKKTLIAPMGKNRRHMVFEKEVAEAERPAEGKGLWPRRRK